MLLIRCYDHLAATGEDKLTGPTSKFLIVFSDNVYLLLLRFNVFLRLQLNQLEKWDSFSLYEQHGMNIKKLCCQLLWPSSRKTEVRHRKIDWMQPPILTVLVFKDFYAEYAALTLRDCSRGNYTSQTFFASNIMRKLARLLLKSFCTCSQLSPI